MLRLLVVLIFLPVTLFSQVNLNLGLVAYYPFSGSAADASGNGNNGILQNGVTFVADRLGNPNSAVHFDGVNDYIQVPHTGSLSPAGGFSFVVQFKTESIVDVQTLLARRRATDQTQAQFQTFINWSVHPGFGYAHNYTNNTQCNTAIISYNVYNGTGAGTIILNRWHCVVGTFDGSKQQIYLDGVLKETLTTPLSVMDVCQNVPMTIAKYTDPDPQYFKGTMDEIRIYNRALNQSEVNALCTLCSVVTSNDMADCVGSSFQLNTTGAATYTWLPPTGLNDAGIPNPKATPTVSTRYIVTGTTSDGCVAKDTVDITIYQKPVVTKSRDTTICIGKSVQITAGGGTSYNWTPTSTLDNINIANPTATPTDSTMYYVLVTDNHNCTANDSVKVNVKKLPVFSVSPGKIICPEGTTQLLAAGGDIYDWQPATGLDDNSIANPLATPLSTTNYTVQITDKICAVSSALSTMITVATLPNVVAVKSDDLDCSIDQSQLTASGASEYVWTPATTLDNPNIYNPVARPTITTRYIVKGTDALGCVNYDTVDVNVLATNIASFLMPSAFTPNKDGKNDCYGIKYWGIIQELEFSIYNRWGQCVFQSSNPLQCWDGTFKGIEQDPGVFVYMIKAKTTCTSNVFRKGTFVLIR